MYRYYRKKRIFCPKPLSKRTCMERTAELLADKIMLDVLHNYGEIVGEVRMEVARIIARRLTDSYLKERDKVDGVSETGTKR